MFQLMKRMLKVSRETTIEWIATLLNANELRSSISVRVHPSREPEPACSDGRIVFLICSRHTLEHT